MAERLEFKGDYMGFTYNKTHSSELGIVRTSNGSRFDENLLPTIQDKTVQVPGGDGTYYFGSYYTQRQISVSYAFDALTEEQLERIKRLFGDKKIHELIFDEAPYKAYRTKVTGTASLKYIPFDEGETHRLYKGEGSVQFTCYQPFAICKKKYLSDYITKEILTQETYEKNKYYVYDGEGKFVLAQDEFDKQARYYSNIGNINEWAAASGLLESKGQHDDDYDSITGKTDSEGFAYLKIKLYNPGVKDTDWYLKLTCIELSCCGYILTLENEQGETIATLRINTPSQDRYDSFVFDSKTCLITNSKEEICNKYITAGDFFKIPQGTSILTLQKIGSLNGKQGDANLYADEISDFSYNYYYF